ncbi:hypothetical protein HPB51_023678 [Rhipicephalus microplus]|uniref:Uncharacterized protein n=1 Tax=Rhipicephalus microplus TaxID=6941 RepID=A0A9J6DXA4_RHIMP|nr:hypothetical protein HPB51_023678 [Rhipicephalus microplus]
MSMTDSRACGDIPGVYRAEEVEEDMKMVGTPDGLLYEDSEGTQLSRFVLNLRRNNGYLLGQIGNANQTPLYFDMPGSTTVEKKGAKQVRVLTSVHGDLASKPAQGVQNSMPQYDTVLHCPAGRKTTFGPASKEETSAFLAPLKGVELVRVNHQRNVAAADVPTGAYLDYLLAMADICGVAERAKQTSLSACNGAIYNVDPALDEQQIRNNISCCEAVLECSRRNCRSLHCHQAEHAAIPPLRDYDVLALQETYARAVDVSVAGYIGYSSPTVCTSQAQHYMPPCHP